MRNLNLKPQLSPTLSHPKPSTLNSLQHSHPKVYMGVMRILNLKPQLSPTLSDPKAHMAERRINEMEFGSFCGPATGVCMCVCVRKREGGGGRRAKEIPHSIKCTRFATDTCTEAQ